MTTTDFSTLSLHDALPILFLGAAAFSQSFVLAAFMGGMALGAWLASRWSARSPNLLALYGWIEAAIGVLALVFRSEEHTSELQSRRDLVCRLLLEKKKKYK